MDNGYDDGDDLLVPMGNFLEVTVESPESYFKAEDAVASSFGYDKRREEDLESIIIHVCGKCGMEFESPSYFEQHLDNMHTDLLRGRNMKMHILSSTDAQCLICGSPVPHQTVRHLQTHYLSHLKHKPYKCKCHGYCFDHKTTVLAHLIYEQSKREPFPPLTRSIPPTKKEPLDDSACTSFSRDDGTFFQGRYSETAIGYVCPECGDSFGGEEGWRIHCNDKHGFKTLEGLNMERLDEHSVRCKECGARFSGKCDNYKLRRHKLTHSPYKGFYCRLCNYSRKRKDDLALHVRKAHCSGKKTKFY